MFEDLTIDEVGYATHAGSEGEFWLRIRKRGGVTEVDILGADSLFDGDDIAALARSSDFWRTTAPTGSC